MKSLKDPTYPSTGTPASAGEQQASGGVGVDGGDAAGRFGCGIEGANAMELLVPREGRLVAEAVVEGEAARYFVAVLRVEAVELVAIVDELTGGLLERGQVAEQEAGVGVAGVVPEEKPKEPGC